MQVYFCNLYDYSLIKIFQLYFMLKCALVLTIIVNFAFSGFGNDVTAHEVDRIWVLAQAAEQGSHPSTPPSMFPINR